MIILVLGDLHYDLRKFDWVANVATAVDVVVLVGDHMEIASTVPRPAQSILVQKYFQRIRKQATLIVSSGNHDLDAPDSNGEMATRWIGNARHSGVSTDGDSISVGDALFTVCPWIDGEHQRAEQTERFRRDAAKRLGLWLWVYHSPPDDSPTSLRRGRSCGDPWLSEWIGEFAPDLALTGHVHEAPFSKDGRWVDRIGPTWVFNAGHQVGPFPSFILLDTDAGRATWSSLAGTEHIALNADAGAVLTDPGEAPELPAAFLQAARPAEH